MVVPLVDSLRDDVDVGRRAGSRNRRGHEENNKVAQDGI
jgi:hypothetical protein